MYTYEDCTNLKIHISLFIRIIMATEKERIVSPAVKNLITVAITLIICIGLFIWGMVLRGKRLELEAAAEHYSVECDEQAMINDERAELLKPERESELLSRAAAADGYVDSADTVFRLKN